MFEDSEDFDCVFDEEEEAVEDEEAERLRRLMSTG